VRAVKLAIVYCPSDQRTSIGVWHDRSGLDAIPEPRAITAGIDDDCGTYGSGSAAEKQCYDPSGLY
jgi:hypothetical protein